MATNAEARDAALEARENAKEAASEFNDKAADVTKGARDWASSFIAGASDTMQGIGTVLKGETLLAGEGLAVGVGKAKSAVHELRSTAADRFHDFFQFMADETGEYSESEGQKADTAVDDAREGYETAVYGDSEPDQKSTKDIDKAIEKSQSKNMGKTLEA